MFKAYMCSVCLDQTPWIAQADAVPILNILACRKFGKEDSEYSFQLLQTLPPVCSELLAAPSLESFSSFQAGVATAMAEMADRSLPWLCTQYSTSKGVVLTVCVCVRV